jgi:hypothetical protein
MTGLLKNTRLQRYACLPALRRTHEERGMGMQTGIVSALPCGRTVFVIRPDRSQDATSGRRCVSEVASALPCGRTLQLEELR